jgi:hypothetical protein
LAPGRAQETDPVADGALHGEAVQASHDQRVREELEDRGFRVIAITGTSFANQVRSYPDVFGALAEEPQPEREQQSSTIEELLARGESETLEFKSSLRLGVPSATAVRRFCTCGNRYAAHMSLFDARRREQGLQAVAQFG